eukprot:364615-Chlamydomonas_euryale.AAC.44
MACCQLTPWAWFAPASRSQTSPSQPDSQSATAGDQTECRAEIASQGHCATSRSRSSHCLQARQARGPKGS